MSGLCGWPLAGCGCGNGCWSNYSPETIESAKALATGLMWAATARRFGACPVTVLPCNPPRTTPLYQTYPVTYPTGTDDGAGLMSYPVLDSGVWRNVGSCGGGCGCTSSCEVVLPGPVAAIVEVMVDGVVVAPGAYQVHNRELLVRIDGQCWPTCQSFGEVPGFEVAYLLGDVPPPDVVAAAELLTCEFAKACVGGKCALPRQMTQLTRQGVQVTLQDVVAKIPAPISRIFTGLKAVDDVIDAYNPFGLLGQPQVSSPDLPSTRTVTWSAAS